MSVPFDRQIWSAEECAAYLGQKYSTFIKRSKRVGIKGLTFHDLKHTAMTRLSKS